MFMLLTFKFELLKQFDGINNYFNPTSNGKSILFRYESKLNGHLNSEIITSTGIIILRNYTDDLYTYSYEDPRYINEYEMSICVCKKDKFTLSVLNVEFKTYNLLTKKFKNFKTQNTHFEKHWQFYADKIIYHVNPYTILNSDEVVIYKKELNWTPWSEKYGNPGLSTNIFDVDGDEYLIFHSYKNINGINLRYYCGILKVKNLIPIAYTLDPIFPSVENYNQELFTTYYNWKRTEKSFPTLVDVIFPMNVIVNRNVLDIYAGMNDCMCVKMTINKTVFKEKLKNMPWILI